MATSIDDVPTDVLYAIACLLHPRDCLSVRSTCKTMNIKLSDSKYHSTRALRNYGLRGEYAKLACVYLDREMVHTQDDEEFDIEMEFFLLKGAQEHARIALCMLQSNAIHFMSNDTVLSYLDSIAHKEGEWCKVGECALQYLRDDLCTSYNDRTRRYMRARRFGVVYRFKMYA